VQTVQHSSGGAIIEKIKKPSINVHRYEIALLENNYIMNIRAG